MAVVNWSLQHFSDTAANMTANNPVLLEGQIGIETDGLTTTPKFKIGDGSTVWNTLPYANGTGIFQPLATNLTSWAGVTRASGFDTFVATPSSANLASLVTDETGSGSLVFGTSPTFTTDITTPKINGVTNALTINAATTLLDEMYLGTGASRGIWSWNASTVILRSGTSAANFTIGTPAYTSNFVSYNATGNIAIGGVADNATDQLQVSNHIGTPVLNLRGRSGAAPTQLNFIPFDATNSIITFKNTSGTTRGFIDLNIASGEMKLWGSSGGYYVSIGANNAAVATFNLTTTTFTQNATSSGAITPFTFTTPTNTGQTASTEISNFKVNGASKTWAAGAITTQRWNYFTANTAAFASASTISESVGLAVEAATAGTNATITNNFALGLTAGTATLKFGNYTGSTTASAIYMNQAVPSTTNYILYSTGSTNQLNTPSGATLYLTYAGSSVMGVTNSAHDVAFNSRVISSGATIPFTFTIGADTGQTASTEIPNFKITGNTKTWAAGAITTQRWNYFTANTAAFASASTITNSYGLYVEAATAGTNATITNNYALGLAVTGTGVGKYILGGSGGDGGTYYMGDVAANSPAMWLQKAAPSTTNYAFVGTSTTFSINGFPTLNLRSNGTTVLTVTDTATITIADTVNFALNTGTGTKFATSTSQKLSFWNATPIVQPTTGVAAATFVANTSGIANDTATFDGYTIGQVVKALRNTGLLA